MNPAPDNLPTTADDQSCAFCGSTQVRWLHPLDMALVEYREFGKGHTLPQFWTLCDRCEVLYRSGDEDAMVDVLLASDTWAGTTLIDADEQLRRPLVVFRRADLGARPLSSRPPRPGSLNT